MLEGRFDSRVSVDLYLHFGSSHTCMEQFGIHPLHRIQTSLA
jgi:hypothetical protein